MVVRSALDCAARVHNEMEDDKYGSPLVLLVISGGYILSERSILCSVAACYLICRGFIVGREREISPAPT